MFGPDEVYGISHIHIIILPKFGSCEIIVEPYSPYPKFAIVQLSTYKILCRISMLEPIYVEEDSTTVRLSKESKSILMSELVKDKAMSIFGEIDDFIWRLMLIGWSCSNDEELQYSIKYDISSIPDYTKLPD